MALIVETGTGLSNANSYLSVEGADTYHADHSGSTDWSGAIQANKERALRLATQYLDVRYGERFEGYKGSSTQALYWPRNGVYCDGYYCLPDEIPQRLKNACAELALRVVQGDTLLGDIDEPGSVKSESVKVGPITESKEYMGGKSQAKKYPIVESLLKVLVRSADIVERG